MVSLALYQPDIPQNVGAAIRLCACLGVTLHIIEPTGFPWKEREFKRAGMDYINHVDLVRHISWDSFLQNTAPARVILVETDGVKSVWDFTFKPDDILLMGRESAGVPTTVYSQAHATVHIPMKGLVRSMNVITAASLTLGEALRQTRYK
jgi:tRNA (cytidine/uridine-2'-O-)-methyltransferase